jgi:hypothetical protein
VRIRGIPARPRGHNNQPVNIESSPPPRRAAARPSNLQRARHIQRPMTAEGTCSHRCTLHRALMSGHDGAPAAAAKVAAAQEHWLQSSLLARYRGAAAGPGAAALDCPARSMLSQRPARPALSASPPF